MHVFQRAIGQDVPVQPSVHVELNALNLDIVSGVGPARVTGTIPDQVVTEDLRLAPAIKDGRVIPDSRHFFDRC